MDERRRARRLPVDVPIELANGSGRTKDVSGLGVQFRCPEVFKAGDQIDFILHLPEAGRVRCDGTVVRCEEEVGLYTVAATIDRFSQEQPEATHPVVDELRHYHPDGWEWGE